MSGRGWVGALVLVLLYALMGLVVGLGLSWAVSRY